MWAADGERQDLCGSVKFVLSDRRDGRRGNAIRRGPRMDRKAQQSFVFIGYSELLSEEAEDREVKEFIEENREKKD